jgi:hypothetical protein
MLIGLYIVSTLFVYMLEGASPDKTLTAPDFVGETMHYSLKYGIFNIGVASISCLEDQAGCGYIIKAEAQSTGLLKIFRNLNYRFECCMDPATGLPKSAVMDLKDRNHTAYNKVLFDHDSRSDSSIIISQTTGKHVVPKNIHDLLTGYYHFRKNFLIESVNNGHPVVIQTFLADMLWDLKMTYIGGETINTMYGQLSCLRFTSSTVVGRFFRNDDDMTVWFTKDEIPIPVKIRLNLRLGSIKGELDKYQRAKHV